MAGEASGDRLGAGLARALRERRPDVELFGMGGDLMAEVGVRVVQNYSGIAVVGLSEVLMHLPALRRAMRRVSDCLESERPDLLVPVDYPEFNLKVAKRAQELGVPVVYYVSPQVWAWRRGRVRRIRDLVRRMLVLFPFEPRIYEESNVPVTFVGHPAGEPPEDGRSREELCAHAGLDPSRPVVGLLPGSRSVEVRRLLPTMLDTVALLRSSRPELQCLILEAPGLPAAKLRELAERSSVESYRIHAGDFPAILGVCSVGLVAAGTASLEAAVAGLPMAVVHRISWPTYYIGRKLVRLDHVALPNLIIGRRVVPELLQAGFTPERAAAVLSGYLDRPAETESVRKALLEVKQMLGGPGAFARAARAVLAELDGSPRNDTV